MNFIENDGSIDIAMRHDTFTPNYYDTIMFNGEINPLKDFTFRVNDTHGLITLSLNIDEYRNDKVLLGAMVGDVFIDSCISSRIPIVTMEYKTSPSTPSMVSSVTMDDSDCVIIRYYNEVTIYAEFRNVEYDISNIHLEFISGGSYNFLEILKNSGKMKIIVMDE